MFTSKRRKKRRKMSWVANVFGPLHVLQKHISFRLQLRVKGVAA